MSYPSTIKADPRYHPARWRKTANLAKKLTGGRCVYCLVAPADEVHHAYYGLHFLGMTLPISGFEIPGWQCFPLCYGHHRRVAHKMGKNGNYIVSRNSHWLNRNRHGFIWRLRFCFLLTVFTVWALPIVALLASAAFLLAR